MYRTRKFVLRFWFVTYVREINTLSIKIVEDLKRCFFPLQIRAFSPHESPILRRNWHVQSVRKRSDFFPEIFRSRPFITLTKPAKNKLKLLASYTLEEVHIERRLSSSGRKATYLWSN